MYTIDFRNPTNTYAFSIVGNKDVDLVYLYSNLGAYASYKVYVKILSDNVADKIEINSQDISADNGVLLVKWTMGELATKCRNLKVQLQLENEQEGKIIQSRVVEIKLGNNIDPEAEAETIYPNIIEDLQEQIDDLKAHSVASIETAFENSTLTMTLKNIDGKVIDTVEVTIPIS